MIGRRLGSRVHRAAVLAVLLTLLLPMSAHATPSPVNADEAYGSIAYSASTGVLVAELSGSGESAAIAAIKACRGKGGGDDCWAVNWFHQAVGAFALASNGAFGTGYGWASTEERARGGPRSMRWRTARATAARTAQ